MHRWEEEVDLTLEEMSRVLHYMDWRAQYWRSLVSSCQVSDTTLQEGTAAYAEKQAYIVQEMALKFSQKWLPELRGDPIVLAWPERYRVTTTS
jgi:hypothetical protein